MTTAGSGRVTAPGCSPSLRPIGARSGRPSQLVHGDLFNNVLFAGDAPPAVIDITPYWRPVGWAVGVIAVDALAWGEAPIEIMTEWRRWRDWPELLAAGVALSAGGQPRPPADSAQ